MRLDEGLVGLVAEELQPLIVDDAPSHPRFKYFKDAGEDPYRSFLGVPLIDRGLLQGVLVVQTVTARAFDPAMVAAISAAGHQLSHVVSLARTQGQFVAPTQERLRRLSSNLWWSWDQDTTSLFRDLDPGLWRRLGHNPVALLQQLPVTTIDERASQLALHGRINYAYRRLEEYLGSRDTWGERHAGVLRTRPVAYFSAEFGLHESLPIYSGGLGILSGDHIKAASDLGIPLVGVGLYYDQGYFRQRLDDEMCQQEEYLDVDAATLPIRPATTKDGRTVTVSVETRTGTISARVWTVPVGRTTLLLLDSDVEGNPPEDRELTARLYGGDERARIRQELLLGVGGARALRALGYTPGVAHLNEGHSAFAAIEFARQRMEREGLSAQEALRVGRLAHRLHHPHAGAGRPRPLLAGSRRGAPRAAARRDGGRPRGAARMGPARSAQPARDVLHDGAGAEAVAPRQRRVGSARAGVAGDVDRALPGPERGARPDRPHHQRRPRADVAGGADAPPLRSPSRRRLAAALRRSGELGGDRSGRRRRAVGDALDAADAADRVRAAAGDRGGDPPRRARGGRRNGAAGAQPRRAHHRVRAALRHLQAGDARDARHGADRGAGQRSAAPDPVHLRRQGAPARHARQGLPGRHRAADARLAVRRQAAVHRGLRHRRRPAPGAGRRRVAEHAAPPARGVRHQRPEGRAERRPEPVGAGRLVGGSLRRPERLRHRPGRHAHRFRRPRRPGRRSADRHVDERGRAALLRSRPRRPAARLDRAHEAHHPHARLAVQRRPHAARLRAALLHPGGGRHVRRYARS